MSEPLFDQQESRLTPWGATFDGRCRELVEEAIAFANKNDLSLHEAQFVMMSAVQIPFCRAILRKRQKPGEGLEAEIERRRQDPPLEHVCIDPRMPELPSPVMVWRRIRRHQIEKALRELGLTSGQYSIRGGRDSSNMFWLVLMHHVGATQGEKAIAGLQRWLKSYKWPEAIIEGVPGTGPEPYRTRINIIKQVEER